MQVTINIPERLYRSLKNRTPTHAENLALYEYIMDGIPVDNSFCEDCISRSRFMIKLMDAGVDHVQTDDLQEINQILQSMEPMDCTKCPTNCIYCVYLRLNNAPICTAKNEYRSIGSCKYLNNCKLFKLIEGLIKKIIQLPVQENEEGQDMYQAYDVLRTIREYCEVDE